eukprot:TRINITY_DN58806_c0_g1_i1.p1 TRINITY_DN58806_c0_g1~~TRINITY_DN58806_c0_g1_i1.p1  ORF type:complete len:510 (-),score=47.12 TRINITY_DN58806_c0_g1_i1:109-1638(-)
MKKADESCTSCTCTAFLAVVLMARVGQSFDTSDYAYMMDRSAGFCPGPFELWYYRVPFAGGVKRCGKNVIDGPPLPLKPPPPPTTTLTTTTVLTTVPGFQEEFAASCCTTLPPPTTELPDYTTNPPYDYAWHTSTATATTSFTVTLTVVTTTVSTITRTRLTYTMTSTYVAPIWNGTGNTSTSTSSTSFIYINFTSTSSTSAITHTTSSTSVTNTSTTSWTNTSTATTTSFTNTTTSVTSSSRTKSSITKTTTKTTTTITSTTTELPNPRVGCMPLCPRLTPQACRETLNADVTCETRLLDSACFEPSNLVFSCPGTNMNPQRNQSLISGHYGVKCWVCSLDETSYINGKLPDSDTRSGHILVDLRFGPNMVGSLLDESPIEGYVIFLTDLEGHRYSWPPVWTGLKRALPLLDRHGCCNEKHYSARIATPLPEGVSKVRFEVAPILNGLGPLSVGRISAHVEDSHPFRARQSSVASRSHVRIPFLTLLLGAAMLLPCWNSLASLWAEES